MVFAFIFGLLVMLINISFSIVSFIVERPLETYYFPTMSLALAPALTLSAETDGPETEPKGN